MYNISKKNKQKEKQTKQQKKWIKKETSFKRNRQNMIFNISVEDGRGGRGVG